MERALFRQVNHVTILAPRAHELFSTFVESMALPVAWPFQDYGAFASGGVSFGDCALEVLRGPAHLTEALVWGVALEPTDGSALVAALARRGIAHGEPATSREPGSGAPMWTNVRLDPGGPQDPSLFSCDYHFVDVPSELAKGRAELCARNGGPIRAMGCARLELSVAKRGLTLPQWTELLAPLPTALGRCTFAAGPDIQIVPGSGAPDRIVLRVRSLDAAEAALGRLGCFVARSGDGSSTVTGGPLQGLALSLEEG